MASLNEARAAFAAAYNKRDRAAMRDAIESYRAAQGALKQSYANIEKEARTYDPTSGMTGQEKFKSGIGSGLVNVARRGTALALPESLTPEFASRAKIEEQTELDRPLLETGAGSAGRFVGDVAATMPIGGLAGGAVRGVMARALPTAVKLGKAVPWAVEGMAGSAASSDTGMGEAAIAGMVGGKVGEKLGQVLSGAVRGLKRTPEAAHLLELGADLTPGQLNPMGRMARIEAAGKQAPLGLGAAISEAQEAGLRPVVPNAIADASGTLRMGAKIEPQEALQEALGRTDQMYKVAEGLAIKPSTLRAKGGELVNTFKQAMRNNPLANRREIKKLVDHVWRSVADDPTTTAAQAARSEIRAAKRAARYGANRTRADFHTAKVYESVEKELTQLIESHLNPSDLGTFRQADKIYRDLQPFITAAVKVGDEPMDRISGKVLEGALKKSMTKREFVGGAGGATRALTRALRHVEEPMGRLRPSFQTLPFVGDIVRLGQGTMALAAASPLVRRLARGTTMGQRGAQKVANTKVAQALVRAMQLARPGVAPAVVSDQNPPQ